jgi:hypothetical protein
MVAAVVPACFGSDTIVHLCLTGNKIGAIENLGVTQVCCCWFRHLLWLSTVRPGAHQQQLAVQQFLAAQLHCQTMALHGAAAFEST